MRTECRKPLHFNDNKIHSLLIETKIYYYYMHFFIIKNTLLTETTPYYCICIFLLLKILEHNFKNVQLTIFLQKDFCFIKFNVHLIAWIYFRLN